MGGHGCPRARACRLSWALNADAQLAGVSIPRVIGPARLSQHSCWERVASEALRGRGGGRAGWLIEAIYIYTHPPGAGRAIDAGCPREGVEVACQGNSGCAVALRRRERSAGALWTTALTSRDSRGCAPGTRYLILEN